MDRAQQTALNRGRRKSVHVLGSLFVQAEVSFFPLLRHQREGNLEALVRMLVSRFVHAWRLVLRYVPAKVCVLNSYCWTNKSNIGDTLHAFGAHNEKAKSEYINSAVIQFAVLAGSNQFFVIIYT